MRSDRFIDRRVDLLMSRVPAVLMMAGGSVGATALALFLFELVGPAAAFGATGFMAGCYLAATILVLSPRHRPLSDRMRGED
jgi:hypothetical protein